MEHLIKTYQDFLDENGEKKWQDFWEKEKLFEAKDGKGEKYYCLIEFPYPSAEGLHVGHPRSYTALDIVARKRRMQGHNVLYPIGWDAFGLPAENYAIKTGTHPRIKTEENINNFRRQLKSLGFSFDWSREVNTTDPEYYKWTQWIFLKLFERGLAYKAEVAINFCTSCKVGLANEEVVGGKCERCGGEVVKKVKSQWMLKITEYADRLEKDLDKVDYIERVKTQQRNWIGRSEGAIVQFKISGSNSSPLTRGRLGGGEGDGNNTPPQPSPYKGEGENIVVYTTRPDTLFGATYMVLAPEHELVQQLKDQIENFDEVEKYITDAAKKSDLERTELNKEKTGVELKGIKAINPVNNKEIPVWISDYVLAGYGTGAIMAVPAHDERDFEFAKKFNLPMITVITPNKKNVIGIGAMIQTKDEKFLFQRRDHQTDRNPGMLAFFGGGIEGQEDIEQTLKREVKEELNLEINNFVLLNKLESHNKPGSFLDIFYVRDIKEERIKLGEGAGIEKLDLLEALERDDVTPFTKKAIKYLLENKCFTEIDQGQMINSDFLNGLLPAEAIKKMTAWLEEKGVGKKAVNYKLRDWVFSRQRYWGEPIPVAYCENCASKIKEIFRDNSSPFIRGRLGGGNGDDNTPPQPSPYKGEGEYSIGEILNPGFVPLSEKDLPLVLPEVTEFQAGEDGESPLAKLTDWVNVKCPKCGGEAKRETDTMPQWAGSSWYFLRYCDPRNKKALASEKNLKYWTPVDWYNGGMEHTTLHLLYSRFWHKFLFDIGVVPTDEPYQKRTSHGMVLGEGGEKMSKSRGNVINPDDVVKQYGADTLRVYEMFMGPFDSAIPWDTKGVVGVRRFLDKVWNLFVEHGTPNMEKEDNGNMEILLNQTIKKVSDDIEGMGFNTAVSALMILTNKLMEQKVADQKILEKLLILLSPFAPHLAEELWEKSGHKKSIIIEKWPVADESKLRSETVEFAVQVNGKLRAKISLPPDVSEAEAVAAAKELDNVKKYLSGQEIKKTIFVPGRMISFVV